MELREILRKMTEQEKMEYIDSTATEYFRNVYYSKEFSSLVYKLGSNKKLTEDEWLYLIEKLYLVTNKAILEEEQLNTFDKINYAINKLGVKIFKQGKIHIECTKMLAFIESVKLEDEINNDLLDCFIKVENSKNEEELNILLKQHREAAIFRDTQDAFLDSYKARQTGVMTANDLLYIDCMDRAFIREKELVKEYK